jgi:hypothetical protein
LGFVPAVSPIVDAIDGRSGSVQGERIAAFIVSGPGFLFLKGVTGMGFDIIRWVFDSVLIWIFG